MDDCIFCNLDNSKLENTILDETDNFYILPSVGSLVDGYILIISKRHINSMSELSTIEMKEYELIIEKYRNIFKEIYGKYPIVFEHGCPIIESNMKANSLTHAHTHIVNHQYSDEQNIIKNLNLTRIEKLENISVKKNYIMYTNSNNIHYISYNFEAISQMMRKLIAIDLNFEEKFDWKKERFDENIKSTISKIKLYNKKN